MWKVNWTTSIRTTSECANAQLIPNFDAYNFTFISMFTLTQYFVCVHLTFEFREMRLPNMQLNYGFRVDSFVLCSLLFSSFSALSLSSLSFSLMRLIIMAEYFKITAIHFGQFLFKRLHVIFNFFLLYFISFEFFFPHSPVQWPQSTILRLTFWTGGFNTVIKFISRLWWHFGLI